VDAAGHSEVPVLPVIGCAFLLKEKSQYLCLRRLFVFVLLTMDAEEAIWTPRGGMFKVDA
jgi:hypothetical protein